MFKLSKIWLKSEYWVPLTLWSRYWFINDFYKTLTTENHRRGLQKSPIRPWVWKSLRCYRHPLYVLCGINYAQKQIWGGWFLILCLSGWSLYPAVIVDAPSWDYSRTVLGFLDKALGIWDFRDRHRWDELYGIDDYFPLVLYLRF